MGCELGLALWCDVDREKWGSGEMTAWPWAGCHIALGLQVH